jgi:hypothetical protein
MKTVKMAVMVGALWLAASAQAKTVRATEMTTADWAQLRSGTAETFVVEFRQGDQLPVYLAAKGDFIETAQPGTTMVSVKRNFWLMLQNNQLQMSLDGSAYKPIQNLVTGAVTADADGSVPGGPADVINIVFSAILK